MHALKGQLRIAQGNALGLKGVVLTCALKGQLHECALEFGICTIICFMQLPFQGASYLFTYYPGRCPGLCAPALSGRSCAKGIHKKLMLINESHFANWGYIKLDSLSFNIGSTWAV